MPRKARTYSEMGIYHVCLRSVNQQIIFEEDADYFQYLNTLAECKQKYDIDIYAYCLMSNHMHLLMRAEPGIIDRFFRSSGVKFVQWYYNIKYQRTGHLFQDRFFSKPITSESQFLATLKYIHNNPVKANVCRFPNEYRWSSCAAYYGKKDSIVNTTYAIGVKGSLDDLQRYFMNYEDDEEIEDSLIAITRPEPKLKMSEEEAIQCCHAVTGLSSPSEFQHLPRVQRNVYIRALLEKQLSYSQIARLTGVSAVTIKRIKERM